MEVTKVCLYLEVDGKTCIAKTSDVVDLDLMINMIGSLTESGTLKCFPLGKEFKWETIAQQTQTKT